MTLFKLLMAGLAVFLVGCGTPIHRPTLTISTTALGQAYYPIPEIQQSVRNDSDGFRGYRASVRNITPADFVEFEKKVALLKQRCALGIAREHFSRRDYPNPHISGYSKSFAAIGAGIPEQLMVVEYSIDFECIRPQAQQKYR